MAVPTITSITPNAGPAGGWTVIDIVGTGFRTRVASYAVPQPDLPPTVGVTFGGQAARYIQVLSATLLRVMVPQCRQVAVDVEALDAVSVVVSNLDDAGAVIVVPAPETVTLAAGYTYQRATVAPTGDPPVMGVLRAFIRLLKRELWRGTVLKTHPDFSDDGASVVVLSAVPMVAMRVAEEHDGEWRQWDNCREYLPTAEGWDQYRPPRTTQLNIDLTLSAEGEGVVQGLKDCLIEAIRLNPFLRVAGDARWLPNVPNDYPLDISRDPKQSGSAGLIEAYDMQVQVRGIPIVLNQPEAKVFAKDTADLVMTRVLLEES